MLKKLLAVSFGLLLVLGAHAASVDLAPGHPDTYVVKRGDTLWDIAGRFLKRPWLWPEIWQANPQIANPHLIYPGDVLSLAYLGEGSELSLRRARREALDPIETIPLSAIESYLRNLRIMSDESLQSLPYVVGLEEDRLRGAAGHVAYARGIPEARPGDLYAIVRPTNRYSRTFRDAWDHYTVRSEGLDRRGEVDHMNQRGYWYDKQFGDGREADDLGWEVMQLTTAQVTRSQGAGIDVATLMLADEGDEVREGDRLMPVQPQPFDLYFTPHPPPTVAPYGLIRVLAVSEALSFGGPNQVMAISAGSEQGIDPGTVFSIWREGDYKPDNIVNHNKIASREDRVRLPDEFAGHAMVFRSYDQVSYALIMDSIKSTHVGNHLKHPDATR